MSMRTLILSAISIASLTSNPAFAVGKSYSEPSTSVASTCPYAKHETAGFADRMIDGGRNEIARTPTRPTSDSSAID